MMFPFQQSNELCFQISSTTHQDHIIWEDEDQLIMLHGDSFDFKRENYNTASPDHGHGKEKLLCFSGNNNNNNNRDQNKDDYDHCLRKSVHRETEKKRRQNMAQLYSSLRSLLPLEYIKGKRSISDHMMEAVKYTEDLQKKINELICKRDELKKMANWRRFGGHGGNMDDPFPEIVQVNQCVGGLEILVVNGSSNAKEEVPLSLVLDTLFKERLCVVSCTSAMANGRLIHTIRLETGDGFRIDLQGLQWKLNQALGSMMFFTK